MVVVGVADGAVTPGAEEEVCYCGRVWRGWGGEGDCERGDGGEEEEFGEKR